MAQKLRIRSNVCKFIFLLTFMSCLHNTRTEEEKRQCQEITLPMCKGIGYNYTYMPNEFNHETQEEAAMEVHPYWPLVEIQCSPDLKFFLCSMYAPICMENYKKPLPACRSVCERARDGCAPLMRQYGFQWPERMNCERLPQHGVKDQLCMEQNTTEKERATQTTPKTRKPGDWGRSRHNPIDLFPSPITMRPPYYGPITLPTDVKRRDCSCSCKPPLVSIPHDSNSQYNRVSTGGIRNCAMNCTSAYFSEDEKTFAQFWLGLWSILCVIATSMTVTTFFIDMQRFKYPERPIIFLSACYFMVSVGYIIRIVVGHDQVACDGGMIRYETTGPATCTVVFLLIYFFGMASSIWWVILTFTWFLSAGLKWGQEAIASYSQYFHLAAWLVPSLKSIAILAMSSVDGDPIAGVCFVGNQNLDNLRGFVLAPLFVYLIIGTSFLLAGFVSLFRIRNVIKQSGRGTTDKLEKLMIRIGVFSVLYTVPATIVIACYFYEQHLREEWEKSLVCPCRANSVRPDYSVFMLKYFMCLVVGITSGFWIWTGKTLESWKKLFNGRLCCKEADNYSNRMIKYTNPNYQGGTIKNYPNVKPQPLSHV